MNFPRPQVLESLSRLVKALSVLEKYGCNLTNPARPKYWRNVKHNNPTFKRTVDSIKVGKLPRILSVFKAGLPQSPSSDPFLLFFQGGRRVLYLYGYTNQQIDGLSFPDEVSEPDAEKVAALTLEVMVFRAELDLILQVF